MEFEPQDQEIVSLLTKLKGAEGQYPEHMLVARREMFLKRMSDISMGINPDATLPGAASSGPPPISPLTSTILETTLVLAIIVEASAVAYFYRDQLADFFETITVEPRTAVVASPPIPTTALEIQGIIPSPVITPTLPPTSMVISPSPIGTTLVPVVTPFPGVAEESNTTSGAGSVTANSTPVSGGNNTSSPGQGNNGGQTPQPEPTRDDNGNHYGQTPQPERTKENSGNHYGQTPQAERTRENNGNGSPGNGNNGLPRNEVTPTPPAGNE